MNLRSTDLNLLTIFDALISEGNMTKAAEKLNMSQPAVSNALSRLRLQFKDPLFIRTAQGMTPTNKAIELHAPISQALNTIQETLEARLEFVPKHSNRCFTLSLGDYGEIMFLPLLSRILREQAPFTQLSIELETGHALSKSLKQGQTDIAFDYLRINNPEYQHIEMGTEELAVVGSKYNEKLKERLSIETYLSLPHVVLKNRDRIGTPLEIVLGQKKLNRIATVEVSHMLSMPSMVATTDMICTIPKRLAELYADMLPLTIMPTPFDSPTIPVYMIWHKNFDQDEAHIWLREQILGLRELAMDL